MLLFFKANFGHLSHLWTFFSSDSIVEFEQVNVNNETDLLITNESKMEISCQETHLSEYSSKLLIKHCNIRHTK